VSSKAIDASRITEVARPDAVEAAYWAEAVSGDVQAAEVVRASARPGPRCSPGRVVAGPDQAWSVIAPGHEQEYVVALAATQDRNRGESGEG